MKTVLITGATGFLGSHIVSHLLDCGYRVIALKRKTSNLGKCTSFVEQVQWVDYQENWSEHVIHFPDMIIHAAWTGVAAKERNVWAIQLSNIDFLQDLLEQAKIWHTSRFIALGSFAEYGQFTDPVSEDFPLQPTSAYGAVKVLCQHLTASFCEKNKIDWFWLRLFSFFGKGEDHTWLIPSVMDSIKQKQKMDLTPCEQQCAYLHVDRLAICIRNVLETTAQSGIYNVGASRSIVLKELILKIKNLLDPHFDQLCFGALPYRPQQQMLVVGNMDKFKQNIGPIDESNFDWELQQVVING